MSRIAYTDGACKVSNPGICSCAFVTYDGETTEDGNLLEGAKETFSHGRFLGFPHSNNFAEYQAVIMVLEWARDCGHRDLEIWCDSQLVVRQVDQARVLETAGCESIFAAAPDWIDAEVAQRAQRDARK